MTDSDHRPDSVPSESRRRFLKQSGAALASVVVAPGLALAGGSNVTARKKVRIGVVGGRFGAQFYWNEHPDCIVEAVSDLIEARRNTLMKVYKCSKAYNSLEELITDKNIDAVAVFTGAPDHVRHAVACMKAGKHVISAVPAAMNMEEAEELLSTVKSTGLTYMMAETSYYYPSTIAVRQLWKEGKLGDVFYSEGEYHHCGMEFSLWKEGGKHTWRWGLPPMLYPTHCTSFIVGVTGERLTQVTCTGWGDGDPIMDGNPYQNPFWNGTAFFTTNKGNSHRTSVYWRGAFRGHVGAKWYGSSMSVFTADPNGGRGPVIVKHDTKLTKDDAGFYMQEAQVEPFAAPEYWKTDMLPEPMRHDSGHQGSHTFIAHEFIDSLVSGRQPVVDIYEALAYTVPGIIAHKSALAGGKPMAVPVFKR